MNYILIYLIKNNIYKILFQILVGYIVKIWYNRNLIWETKKKKKKFSSSNLEDLNPKHFSVQES